MSTAGKRELGEIAAPYGRRIRLEEIAYESGMTLMRVTIREGGRYTILEIDAATARDWGALMQHWVREQGEARTQAEESHQ